MPKISKSEQRKFIRSILKNADAIPLKSQFEKQKIYSKSGDFGMSTLPDGKWMAKASDMAELYGNLDELNCFAGFAIEALHDNMEFSDILKQLYQIQKDIFDLGVFFAPPARLKKVPDVEKMIAELEKAIDFVTDQLPLMDSFVLPGGGESASRLHLARAVCRRTERAAFRLVDSDKKAELIAIYLNRLSDWFFVAARFSSRLSNVEEIEV